MLDKHRISTRITPDNLIPGIALPEKSRSSRGKRGGAIEHPAEARSSAGGGGGRQSPESTLLLGGRLVISILATGLERISLGTSEGLQTIRSWQKRWASHEQSHGVPTKGPGGMEAKPSNLALTALACIQSVRRCRFGLVLGAYSKLSRQGRIQISRPSKPSSAAYRR